MNSRVVIQNIRPHTTTGQYSAKATIGLLCEVSAVVFRDGHDSICARVRWRNSGDDQWDSAMLSPGHNDVWTGYITPRSIGQAEFVIDAWVDKYGTWAHRTKMKLGDNQDISLEIQEAERLFSIRRQELPVDEYEHTIEHVLRTLNDETLDQSLRVSAALDDAVKRIFFQPTDAQHVTTSEPNGLWVDRLRGQYGAWYELFPRSLGGLAQTTKHLEYVEKMGFDVLYLPPIHPIGEAFKKGKNNSLNATEQDVGSPWAIGSKNGGHKDIHPDLGTIDDFDQLVEEAKTRGIEIALDYALQCSPDHPWVSEHPEWFTTRIDGTIAYAENPPKKYQDIYPIDFWPEKESDRVALWEACKDILTYWHSHGVRIFRVDNPHTKPIAFWAWVIKEMQEIDPEVIFLSEAFTRPAIMAKLAEVGFTQSYTYFTWRSSKHELEEYGEEVVNSEKADFMRPNFWTNTQDILPIQLRNMPLSAFRQRFVLASTMVPSYGIYSGFEYGENEPANTFNEEYLNSEKYEIRRRDTAEAHLAPYISHVNSIRRSHRAFWELRNLKFHKVDSDAVLAYSRKSGEDTGDVIVIVSIDPFNDIETMVHLDMSHLGYMWDEAIHVRDLLTGGTYVWGEHNYVKLTPQDPAHIFEIIKED